ncbi:MAG: serine/threonine-protein kinase [Deltaproteobacteria bacterium]|nr:serine/threonine-protein kinase [Deltaproteobacteria bacterium]
MPEHASQPAAATPPGADQRLDVVEMFRAKAAVRIGLFQGQGGVAAPPSEPTVGRYTLTRTIGQGGFGTVFLGHDPQLHRDVAVKLVPLESDPLTDTAAAAEAQAMARLRHPSLVVVHDVGTCDASRLLPGARRCLFIVMELLEGGPLRQWSAQPRTIREILSVFVQAGEAVVAAHERDVVHRDLKPSNIQVDGTRVTVLDFGLARVMEAQRSHAHDPTYQATSPTGTPSYMAPEQHMGMDVGPAADQYSLAVCLYEAVFGHLPFQGHDAHALAIAKHSGPPVLPVRRGLQRRQRRALRRALDPDPTRRFPTMRAFVDAIAPQRRVGVWLASAVVVSALGLGLGLGPAAEDTSDSCTQFNEHARVLRGQALGSASNDTSPQSTAPGAAQDLRDQFDTRLTAWARARTDACHQQIASSPEQPPSTLIYCLDRYSTRLSTVGELLTTHDPTVASHLGRVAGLLDGLDRCERAQPLPPLPGWLIDDVAAGLEVDALIVRAEAQSESGQRSLAHDDAEAALNEARTLRAPGLEAEAAFVLCRNHGKAKGRAVLEEVCEQALLAAERAQRPRLAIRSRIHIALVYARTRPDIALHHLEQARARRQQLGDDALLDARLAWIEAQVEVGRGHRQEAIETLLMVRSVLRDEYGPNGSDVLGVTNDLALAYEDAGAFDEARAELTRVLDIIQRTRGPDHLTAGAVLNNIGLACDNAGDIDCAQDAFERALAIKERAAGPDSPELLSTLENLVFTYKARGAYEDAHTLARRVIEIADPLPAEQERLDRMRAFEISLSGAPFDAQACRDLEVILDRRSKDPRRLFPVVIADQTARCWIETGRVSTGCALYERFADPAQAWSMDARDDAILISKRAWCSARLGRHAEAIGRFETLENTPGASATARVRALVARAVLVGSKTERGMALLDRATTPAPDAPADPSPPTRQQLLDATTQWLAE